MLTEQMHGQKEEEEEEEEEGENELQMYKRAYQEKTSSIL